jgi:hypothetical protein
LSALSSAAERRVELGARGGLDHPHADDAERRVVDIARVRRDHHFVLRKPGQVRDADVEIRVAAGDTRGGRVRQRRGTARGDEPPLGACQRCQPAADRLGQLVEVDVLPRRQVHRRAHFGQHQRPAEHGVGAARVDERPDPNPPIDVVVGSGAGRRGRGSVSGHRQHRRERGQPADVASAAEQIATADRLIHGSTFPSGDGLPPIPTCRVSCRYSAASSADARGMTRRVASMRTVRRMVTSESLRIRIASFDHQQPASARARMHCAPAEKA